MKVRTFLLYLTELDIAFDQKKLNDFQKILDDNVGAKKTGIVLYPTPYNVVTTFTVVLWALGSTEEENRKIIDKVKKLLNENNIVFKDAESYTIWNEQKVYIEIGLGRDEG